MAFGGSGGVPFCLVCGIVLGVCIENRRIVHACTGKRDSVLRGMRIRGRGESFLSVLQGMGSPADFRRE